MKLRRPMHAALSRRQLLKGMALGGAMATMPWSRRALAQSAQRPNNRKFLIVIAAAGGASIIDSFLAVRASQCSRADELNTFPDAMVQQIGEFTAIDQELRNLGPLPYRGSAEQSGFVQRHQSDMMVVTCTGTSVTHQIAQKRALTGNDAWGGRTLQEAVSASYGEGLPLPNVNMGFAGYQEPGIDRSLPAWARHELVGDARRWGLGLDGMRGIESAPARSLVEMARRTRDERLQPASPFVRTFGASEALGRFMQNRREKQPALETANYMERLNILRSGPATPFDEFGIGSAEEAALVQQVFPNTANDPFEAQAALAYMLLVKDVTATVTIGPGFSPIVEADRGVNVETPPLAFDFSHSGHRATQALMWSRVLGVMDRLIGLLQNIEYKNGESFWDHTMMYVATDFGRTRNRPSGADEFSSGHDLNNGFLVVSPLVNGGRVLGGVDPETTMTYGFDPTTGDPQTGRNMEEKEIYAGLVQALGINPPGNILPDVPAMRRG
ncbi:MAG: twin-arginine translocation signal domain-containing protein [Bradymonadia bacterium]